MEVAEEHWRRMILLRRAVDVEPEETRATLMSFVFFFFVLSGYFVLRPIRDAVAAASGVQQLPWLFTGTLTATLLFNPLFSWLVVRYPARKFVPISFQFFVANLLLFYAMMRFVSPGEGSAIDIWTGRSFYVWTSVLAFFGTSIFWCFMADVFRSDQAKRLFGFIGVGGTIGSIAGSTVTATLAPRIGPVNLLLVSAALLELAALTVMNFPSSPRGVGSAPASVATDAIDNEVIGGTLMNGVTSVLKSRYLLGIALFLILYSVGSTFLYFQQSDIVGRFYADRVARTTILARLELAAQILTVLAQVFFTGRIIRWIGLAATLAVLPALSMLGFGALGVMPVFTTLAIFTVLRRATNFSLTNPAMETLFTVVPREDKYKAKSFIETFVYRGGDQLAAWLYAGLAAVGLGLAGIAFVAVPVSFVWLLLGVWLGRRQAALAANETNRRDAVSNLATPLLMTTGG
ncbi:MAG: Npt1/Npt2 family nucleotide transporter [bacterium]